MIFSDDLLDISWTLHSIQGVRRNFEKLDELIGVRFGRTTSKQSLDRLAEGLLDHLSDRSDREPRDELNDENNRYGRITSCNLRLLEFTPTTVGNEEPGGLLVEAQYQHATHRIIVLRSGRRYNGMQDLALMLCKGNQRFINHFRDWLDTTFDLPPSEVVHLTPLTLLQVFSGFVDVVSTGWPPDATHADALRIALLAQTIGNVKITITLTTPENDLASKLKHIDIDVPSDTINQLIGDNIELESSGRNAGIAALEGLRKGLLEKTGLRLPFTIEPANDGKLQESPCKISKLGCAAFVISTEGRLKFSGKPIEQADLKGYEEGVVRMGMSKILDLLFEGAMTIPRNSEDGLT